MTRFIAAILAMTALTNCNNPFVEGCSCTAKDCFQGVIVNLEEKPDPDRYKDFSMTLAYGDTVEAASDFWSFNDSARFHFSSPRLWRQKPKQVAIRISYSEQDAEKTASLDTVIAWTSFVCNSCSGGSPSCKDDRNYKASVKIGLARLLE